MLYLYSGGEITHPVSPARNFIRRDVFVESTSPKVPENGLICNINWCVLLWLLWLFSLWQPSGTMRPCKSNVVSWGWILGVLNQIYVWWLVRLSPNTDDNSKTWAVDHFWHDSPRAVRTQIVTSVTEKSENNSNTDDFTDSENLLKESLTVGTALGSGVFSLRFWSPMPHIFSRVSILGSCRFRVWGPLLPKLNSGVCAGIWAEGNHARWCSCNSPGKCREFDGFCRICFNHRFKLSSGPVSVTPPDETKEVRAWYFVFFIHDKTAALIPGYVINTGLIQVWTGW